MSGIHKDNGQSWALPPLHSSLPPVLTQLTLALFGGQLWGSPGLTRRPHRAVHPAAGTGTFQQLGYGQAACQLACPIFISLVTHPPGEGALRGAAAFGLGHYTVGLLLAVHSSARRTPNPMGSISGWKVAPLGTCWGCYEKLEHRRNMATLPLSGLLESRSVYRLPQAWLRTSLALVCHASHSILLSSALQARSQHRAWALHCRGSCVQSKALGSGQSSC